MLRFNMSGHSGGSSSGGRGAAANPSPGRGAQSQAGREREVLAKAFAMSTPGMISRAASVVGPAVTGAIESITGAKGTAPAKGASSVNPASEARSDRERDRAGAAARPNPGAVLEPARDVTVSPESLLADEARRKTLAEEQLRRGRTRTLLSGGGRVSDLSVGKTTLFGS